MLLALASLCFATSAKKLTIATDDGPPHMIANNDSGIDLDIVRQVLSAMGYTSDVIYVPLHRAKQLVSDAKADVFLPTFYESDSQSLFFSEPFITYKPTIFSLSKQQIELSSLADLSKYSVISFQGATGYFGESYTAAVSNASYRELHDMSQFPSMLIHQRTDLVVLDYYIFYYYLKQNHPNINITQIDQHMLISEVSAHVGFNDEQLRNEFNQQLNQFRADKLDQKVIEHYIGKQ